jgi:hypothetical protein
MNLMIGIGDQRHAGRRKGQSTGKVRFFAQPRRSICCFCFSGIRVHGMHSLFMARLVSAFTLVALYFTNEEDCEEQG